MLEKRNTGAILHYPCFVKQWDDERLYEHYLTMIKRPDVYCPVHNFGRQGSSLYMVMPLMQKHTEMNNHSVCISALKKLELLWGGDCGSSVSPEREKYQKFIVGLEIPDDLRQLCIILYNETSNMKGTIAADLHGDASIQNIVHDGVDAWWVDPSVRATPLEREVDLGKLMMSLLGYDKATPEMISYCWALLYKYPYTARLVVYYCATHLARIWREQTNRHAWILQTTKELLMGERA